MLASVSFHHLLYLLEQLCDLSAITAFLIVEDLTPFPILSFRATKEPPLYCQRTAQWMSARLL